MALASLRGRFDGPLEIGLACGPGRSYGLKAGNPLVQYGALGKVDFATPSLDSTAPLLAIISDVGNDIVYDQTPAATLAWVADLAGRLESQDAEVVLAGLPLESLRGVPQWLFAILRSIYYAGQQVTREDLFQRLADIEAGLEDLARSRGYLFLPTDPAWYGFDHFHLRSAHYQTSWDTWMERLRPPLVECALPSWGSLWKARPDTYWFRGKERHASGIYENILPKTRLIVR